MEQLSILLLVTQLYLPTTRPESVKIDGSIDLGQNWEFEYTPEPLTQDLDFYRTFQQPTTSNIEPMSSTDMKRHKKRKIKRRNLTTTITRLRNTENERPSVKPEVIWLPDTSPSLAPRVTYITGSTTESSTVSKRKHHHHRSKANKSLAIATDAVSNTNVVYNIVFTSPTPATTTPNKILVDVLRNLGMNMSKYQLPDLGVVAFSADSPTEPPRQTEIIVYNRPYVDTADLYDRPHLVKDDEKIQAFTIFVFRQSLGIFDTLKSKVNSSRIKNKVNFIARTFRDKFADFVNETQNQKILTRLGRQKVVLNTIDTSNRILRRLLNYFTMDMKKKGYLRERRIVADDWKNEVDNEEQQEYVYACQSMNICRSKNSFSTFVAEMMTIVLGTDDTKLMQAVNAFTEVAKNTNFGVERVLQLRIKDSIELMERQNPKVLRSLMWMFRNMLMNKHKPLVVANTYNSAKTVNKTVAAMDFMDMLDERIPATAETQKEWDSMKLNLEQWAKDGKPNVMKIMQRFITHAKNTGDGDVLHSCIDKIKIMLRD